MDCCIVLTILLLKILIRYYFCTLREEKRTECSGILHDFLPGLVMTKEIKEEQNVKLSLMCMCKIPLEGSKKPHKGDCLWEENWVLGKGVPIKRVLSMQEKDAEEDGRKPGTVVFEEMQFDFTCKTKTLLISDIGKTPPLRFDFVFFFFLKKISLH